MTAPPFIHDLPARNPQGNPSGTGQDQHKPAPGSLGEAATYLIGLDDQRTPCRARDVLIRIGSVCGITGLSVPTVYRLMAKGAFPRPVKITTTARAWKLSEITAWVETRERGGVS
jgi:prophage regulatory protein